MLMLIPILALCTIVTGCLWIRAVAREGRAQVRNRKLESELHIEKVTNNQLRRMIARRGERL